MKLTKWLPLSLVSAFVAALHGLRCTLVLFPLFLSDENHCYCIFLSINEQTIQKNNNFAFLLSDITHQHLATTCYWIRFAAMCKRAVQTENKRSFRLIGRNRDESIHWCSEFDSETKVLFLENNKRKSPRLDRVKQIMHKRLPSIIGISSGVFKGRWARHLPQAPHFLEAPPWGVTRVNFP